jgi:hypothetical protein
MRRAGDPDASGRRIVRDDRVVILVRSHYINRWRRRFLAERVDGPCVCRWGSTPTFLTSGMGARILEKARQAPPDGGTHWSAWKLWRVLEFRYNLIAKA